MRTATLNVHYWSKDNKLNFYGLLAELDYHLSSMDVLCLYEVLFGQFLDYEIVLFSKRAKTHVRFDGQDYWLPIDHEDDLYLYLKAHLGLPFDLNLTICRYGDAISVEIDDHILNCWANYYQSLPNTPLREFQTHFGLPYLFFAGTTNPGFGNAILSRYQFQLISSRQLRGISDAQYSTRVALSAVLCSPIPLQVICVHLDHLSEDDRLLQCKQLFEAYPANDECCQILCGDFNSLLFEDYNELQLSTLNLSRKRAGVEAPRFDVMKSVFAHGWVDCAWNAPRPCTLGNVRETCQHGVRIDYILCNSALSSCITNFRVFQMSQTDHNGVFVAFYPVYKTPKYE